jgi:hypothetical protein
MGGKAFPDVVPVPIDKWKPVVDRMIRHLDSPKHAILGSTGKKPFSGDIDLAIDLSSGLTYDSLVERLTLLLGSDNVSPSGRNFDQIYTRYRCDDGPYQVDFMLGDVDLLSFTHYSPAPSESAYGGTHRTELLKAVAKVNSPTTAFRNDRMVVRRGYTLHHDRGLVFNTRWTPPRKDGNGFTQKMVAVSHHDAAVFKTAFPEIEFDALEKTTINPLEISAILFGEPCLELINTYEGVCEAINRSPHLHNQTDLIWKLYTDRLDEIKQPHPRRGI